MIYPHQLPHRSSERLLVLPHRGGTGGLGFTERERESHVTNIAMTHKLQGKPVYSQVFPQAN